MLYMLEDLIHAEDTSMLYMLGIVFLGSYTYTC